MNGSQPFLCPVCENAFLHRKQTQCDRCDYLDEQKKLEARLDMITLGEVDDLDGLKQWIKEYLIK